QIPTGNSILFATPDRPIAGLNLSITGPGATVIRNPRDTFGELLVVMGRNASELKLAAAAIASGRGVLSGARMNFDGVRIPTYARYAAPRW
ncbi:cellulose biosynthesis cyclic di-GMP-binding regulatory protein BcsB, partial [Klebsiella pneumoniae]